MSIRTTIATLYHAVQLARMYPTSSRVKVMRDYIALHRTKGLRPEEYYEFEFDKRSEAFRRDFLGLDEQRYYLELLNPLKYLSLARNKYVAHKMLENTGIRTSELYCYYQPEARYSENTECAGDLAGVLHILKDKAVQGCVIKTTESSHGDNVWVIKSIDYQENDAILTRFDGQQLALSSVLGDEALIFESVVRQTAQLAAFNPSSVNTVRFMTALYPDGSAKVVATFMKIGRAGRCVDNAGGGGNVDVCVELATGEIRHAIQFDGWRNVKDIDSHPDSGAQLNGIVLENWASVKAEVIRFQQAFPYCKVAGWDIALTDEGPVVIEINDFWDRTGQFFIRKGWRNEIRECYLAWKQTGKDYSVGAQRLPLDDKTMAARFQ